ncbi:MAG: hypothetical protein FJ096_09740 [Deltaproteobacteria bacterium]|nr:hypothetical protein [Deltaproteobacteria bacterium]
MSTIPPAGVHPTMPPPPADRARQALGFTTAGLITLLAAVAVSRSTQPNAAQVFTGRNDSEMMASLAKVLFAASGTTEFIGLVHAFLSFRRAATRSSVAFAVAAAWLSVVAWWVSRSS